METKKSSMENFDLNQNLCDSGEHRIHKPQNINSREDLDPENLSPPLPTIDDLWEEHRAQGHESFASIRAKWGLPPAAEGENPVCVTCERTSSKRLPRQKSTNRRSDKPWHRVHIDKAFWSCPTVHGEHYAQIIVDDCSRKVFVQMLKRKNHDLAAFQILKKQLDTLKAPKQLAIIRADGEYAMNKNWDRYREDEGISFEGSAPYCQYQNGVVERSIGVLKTRTRAMMDFSCNPPGDWGYCIQWAAYLKNGTTSKALPNGFSPNLIWEGSSTPLADKTTKHPIFGSLMLAKKYVHGKSEAQAVEATFLGHSTVYKAFILRQLGKNRSRETADR